MRRARYPLRIRRLSAPPRIYRARDRTEGLGNVGDMLATASDDSRSRVRSRGVRSSSQGGEGTTLTGVPRPGEPGEEILDAG